MLRGEEALRRLTCIPQAVAVQQAVAVPVQQEVRLVSGQVPCQVPRQVHPPVRPPVRRPVRQPVRQPVRRLQPPLHDRRHRQLFLALFFRERQRQSSPP